MTKIIISMGRPACEGSRMCASCIWMHAWHARCSRTGRYLSRRSSGLRTIV